MIIQSINGRVLYESERTTFKAALEEAVSRGVDLSHGDFRKRKLVRASLDGMQAAGASFWGADCHEADMAGADLREVDFRAADMQRTCLAQSDCSGANFTGSYLSGAILRHCNMRCAIFSCPSVFSADYEDTECLKHAIYNHRGEVEIPLFPPPLLVRGLSRPLLFTANGLIWGNRHFAGGANDSGMEKDIASLKAVINRFG